MLSLVLAAICVLPGSPAAEVQVDLPFAPLYGGTLYSDNPFIATVSGSARPRNRRATITVQGFIQGEVNLRMRFVSGISVYDLVVGEIIVDDALGVTVSPVHSVVAAGTPVMLSAITSGPDVAVAWYEGERYLGIGHAMSLTLSRGTHRVRAEAWNRCGTVTSEAEITVATPRQRAARH